MICLYKMVLSLHKFNYKCGKLREKKLLFQTFGYALCIVLVSLSRVNFNIYNDAIKKC